MLTINGPQGWPPSGYEVGHGIGSIARLVWLITYLKMDARQWQMIAVGVVEYLAGCGREHPLPRAGFVDAPVAALASQVGGIVQRILFQEGERVHVGQLVAELDAREREAAVEVARANVDRAREAVAEAQQNVHATVPSVSSATADIARAEAELTDARRNFNRIRILVAREAATPSQLDSARARFLQARALVKAMRANRTASRGRVGVSQAGVANARAALESSEAALKQAEALRAEMQILSPFDGLIVDVNLREGEWAAGGTPVITTEDLTHQWVRLDLDETQFTHIRLGQAAEIQLAAFPGRVFTGRVIEIGAEGEFALNRDVKRGRPDVRTFRVRVAIEPPTIELRPGMSAEVIFPP
jgi:multidrug resistance efflux pump